MAEANDLGRFEQTVLPHLDAAFNLARWLTHNEPDAQDVVQEAYLRALKFFGSFHGNDARAWLLAIVRNTCYTWLKKNRGGPVAASFDEEIHGGPHETLNPEALLSRQEDVSAVRQAVDRLPVDLREVLVLREMEGMSYKEIADVVGIPMGTVMSRLARARDRLQSRLASGIQGT